MGIISPTLPTIGDPNSTEDPDTRATLAALVALVNGNIDTANLAAAGVASSDIAALAVTKAKLGADSLAAFLQLGASVLGMRAEFGLDSIPYGGGGTSISRTANYTALSGVPKFAAALPIGVNTSGANPMRAVITGTPTSTQIVFSIVDSQPAVVIGAGTYLTYWIAIG